MENWIDEVPGIIDDGIPVRLEARLLQMFYLVIIIRREDCR